MVQKHAAICSRRMVEASNDDRDRRQFASETDFMRTRIAELEARLATAEAEARAAAEVLTDLSHEMRTPLNAVLGFAGALESDMFGPLGHPKYYEYVDYIRASGRHLLDLVTSILDLSRIEADRYALKRESTDPGAVAAECAGMMRLAAEKAGLQLRTEISADLPRCHLDPRALRQILLNLLANAIKFTSDGSVTLTVDHRDETLRFVVADTGVGMNAQDLARLGTRFTAAQGAGVRGAKGAGLGLALASALSALHGGALTFASAPGEGVTATVLMPVTAPPVARAQRDSPAASERSERSSAQPSGILTQLDRIEAYRRQRPAA